MNYKYLILAVGDISKSQQNNTRIDGNRNITIETDDTNEPIWNRTTFSSNGCMKLILKQIEPPTDDLITAFEFEGSVVKKSGLDLNSLIGCCLIVINPDICRGILLLKASDCQVIRSGTMVHVVSEDIDIIDGLGDDLIEQFLDNDFSFTS
jgi:hypothetical protein